MTDLKLAWRILVVTFLSIGRNWSTVLKAAFMPLILPLALLFGWLSWAWTSGYMRKYLPLHLGGQADFPVFAFCLGLIALLGTFPVAVAWHRFDLTGERPRALLPRPNFGLSLGYLGRSLLIGLMTLLIAVPLVLLLFPIAEKGPRGFVFQLGSLPQPLTAGNFVLNAVSWSVVMGLVLRWSLILPAGALGRKMSLRQSREAAKAHLRLPVFLALGLFLHLAPIGIDLLLAEARLGDLGTVLILPFVLLFWFMFGIALLTTLYAHCVENRPLQ